jgi:hypothetical protein
MVTIAPRIRFDVSIIQAFRAPPSLFAETTIAINVNDSVGAVDGSVVVNSSVVAVDDSVKLNSATTTGTTSAPA